MLSCVKLCDGNLCDVMLSCVKLCDGIVCDVMKCNIVCVVKGKRCNNSNSRASD